MSIKICAVVTFIALLSGCASPPSKPLQKPEPLSQETREAKVEETKLAAEKKEVARLAKVEEAKLAAEKKEVARLAKVEEAKLAAEKKEIARLAKAEEAKLAAEKRKVAQEQADEKVAMAVAGKVAEIEAYTPKKSGLTEINLAFAREMESLLLRGLALSTKKMSAKQQKIAEALYARAEILEPREAIQARIDELEALPASEMSISGKRELDGLNAKIRSRRGYKHILEERTLVRTYGLDGPVDMAFCAGLAICEQ